jgi:DNA-binding response OmpR family regulator
MILVVEDEPGIVDFVERGLRSRGFEVQSALDGESGLERALDPEVELLVLDLMLPRMSGSAILKRLQVARPTLPVIVLTARGELADRIAGLDAGAADYLVKPFSVAELAARVRAQLRSAAREPSTRLQAGELTVDLISREVTVAGSGVRLSTTEFELLVYLLRNRDTVLTREQILRAVWGYGHDPGTNVVDVYVGYLRRKLSTSDRPTPIVTVRSVGYRLDSSAT